MIKSAIGKYWPVAIIAGVVLAFYRKVFQGMVPFPGDLLVGAYYPWLESKWGYMVGVPVKNPLISDVFSAFYIWKDLIADSIKQGQWPLWNPYSYSGYPLLANFNSGALNPANLLMVFFGGAEGWSMMVIWGHLGAGIAMYLFLTSLKQSKIGAVIGALTYAMGGFALTWSQFVTAGQAMIYMPLGLWLIEKGAVNKSRRYIWWIPVAGWLIISSGHFQSVVYSALLWLAYAVYRSPKINDRGAFIWWWIKLIGAGMLTGLMGAILLMPAMEMAGLSVRFDEGYIKSYAYGLLPWGNLITLLAPDYFGNPVRGNFWGFFNYHETVIYGGVWAAIALAGAIYCFRELKKERFFVGSTLVSLIFLFDNPLSRLVYELGVPGLSTSAAGRLAVITSLSMAVLAGWMADRRMKLKVKEVAEIWLLPAAVLIITGVITLALRQVFKQNVGMEEWILRTGSSLKNLAVPTALAVILAGLTLIKHRAATAAIAAIMAADLMWFGMRYIPLMPKEWVFPNMPAIEFIQKQPGIFRIEREMTALLSPNTWAAYRLQSPGGYDPVATKGYVENYERRLNQSADPHTGRYSELAHYEAKELGEFNVKYLLALKRDKEGKTPGEVLSWRIDEEEWKRVWESDYVAVLENLKVRERTFIEGGKAKISSYQPNKVEIDYESEKGGKLVLLDSWYPGWQAEVNGRKKEVEKFEDAFRQVAVPAGKGKAVFTYQPKSFVWGMALSIAGGLMIVGLLIREDTKRRLRR